MNDVTKPLDKHLTHSNLLGDIDVDFGIKALPCGFPSIEALKYIKANVGNVIVVAARPGNGKTALACQIGLNVSEHSKVLMFSMEMEASELKRRLLAVTSGVPIDKLGEPVFSTKLEAAKQKLKTLKYHINADSDLTVDQIIAYTYDENQREKISLLIIDYVGLINLDGQHRVEGIKQAVVAIKKKIADTLKIPVILIAQMNRNFEDRYAQAKFAYEKGRMFPDGENPDILDVRPSMSDLAESSGLEQAADLVLFLQRQYLLDRSKPESAFKVFAEKNRKGSVRDFELDFSGTLTKFVDKGVI